MGERGAFNNGISKLIVTINGIIQFIFNLFMRTTSSNFIFNEFNVNNFNYIYKFSTQIELYKHKHWTTLSDLDRDTRYKQNNVRLLKCNSFS